jgi:DNA mismatch endonuclease (patch repair protein)
MQGQRRRDTDVEMELRSRLHALGLRYRVDVAPLPGIRSRADIVFGPSKVAVFVNGCFWHGCPEHMTWPKANAEWWRAKIDANRERDRRTDERLFAAGWLPIRVWQHDNLAERARDIARVVEKRRSRRC